MEPAETGRRAHPSILLLRRKLSALANTPLLNTDAPGYLDWVKDTLPNTDAASLVDGVALGIIPGTSGTTFNNVVAQATISGDCGTAVTIHYADSLGEVGDFIGNVACS